MILKLPVLLLLSCISLVLLSACGEVKESTQVSAGKQTVLSAPAELVSLQDIAIGPPNVRGMWQFKIEYMARENAMVKTGDLLIKFDGQELQNDLLGRRSNLDAAIKEAEKKKLENEAKLEQLVLDLAQAKMNEEIARRKVEITDVSRSDIERRKQQAQLEIASEAHRQAQSRVAQHKQSMLISEQVQEAKIANQRVRVDQVEQSIAKLSMTAPKDGMVIYASDWSGEKPAIGDTVFMGRTLLELPALDKIAVNVEFDESSSSLVALGAEVKVTLDAFPERPFAGRISEIGQAYRTKSQRNLKVVFDARVTLDTSDGEIMRPGMKARVELLEGQT
ncbi:HlyD family secretion protein [Ningiella sp. W23]|uniref:HlyD family secretion protein n=1 Tax=Ningiella sp. W23 TaxID=3023715 RepID=UPI00375846AB